MTNTSSASMPPIIYGTAWKKEETARLVHQALGAGFRGVDTACQPKHYDELGVGQGIAAFLRESGCSRSEVYIQTKFTSVDGQDPRRIPYDKSLPLHEQVIQSCAISRSNLGVDVLDCLVLHSPMRTFEQTLTVWSAFEQLVATGAVRTLGISNCYKLSLLRALWERARIKPRVVQNRFYADTGYDIDLRQFCVQVNITYQSFWTLTANPRVLEHPRLRAVASRWGWTPAQALLRCLTQTGVVPLVGTTSLVHMVADLDIFRSRLEDGEVSDIVGLLR